MSTHCSQETFRFEAPAGREIVARFDGGTISSDGGALLLSQTEQRVKIIERFARCFVDHRAAGRIGHSVAELVTQRVLGLCLGYEDLNDHERLRTDPLLCSLSGKRDPRAAMAGKSTLSRLELSRCEAARGERYKRIALDTQAVDRLLVDVFLESHARTPRSIVIDLDATDFAIHGRQEGRFFHGFYDHYCYLPLYIFSGEHLLCARLRRSNIDASAGTVEELSGIITQIRSRWPKTSITIRADSGFCREPIMAWCEEEGIDYVLGLARNARLEAQIEQSMEKAKERFEKTGEPARVYSEFRYRTLDTWSKGRRVVAKAEYSRRGDNPRFVVSSLSKKEITAKGLYEELYCARGDMENRIKEQQLGLFADRMSAQTMQANQVRLYFTSIAYTLLHALRRLGLKGTELERAQCETIRLRLLKIGARIKVSVRRIVVALSQAFALQEVFAKVLSNIRARAAPAR